MAEGNDEEQPPPPVLFIVTFLLVAIVIGIFRKRITQILFGSDSVSDRQQQKRTRNDESSPLMQGEMGMVEMSPSMRDIRWSNVLTIFLNGKKLQLVNPDPTALLAGWIRDSVGLKGTKLGCEEGGCGACTVVLTKTDGIVSVNSCLRPLCANDGMAVTTVEGIGSVGSGLSEEQQRLVANNGTQCGYCTPGWITNMHAMNEASAETGVTFTKRQVEQYLDGNICRCTGYRPIVKAFESFASDGSASASGQQQQEQRNKVCIELNCTEQQQQACHSSGHCCTSTADVEDMCHPPRAVSQHQSCCSSTGSMTVASQQYSATTFRGSAAGRRDRALVQSHTAQPLLFFNPVSGKKWIRPVTLKQLCTVLREVSADAQQKVQLVGGNTSIGVTKYLNGTAPYYTADEYNTFIDVNSVSVMTAQGFNQHTRELVVGAATPLSKLISLLRVHAIRPSPSTPIPPAASAAPSDSESGEAVNHHSVFSVTANHLTQIANTQVRNAGSWAGNLMIFLRHQDFPSDAVLALTTAKARLRLCDQDGNLSVIGMDEFLTYSIEQFCAQGLMIVSLLVQESAPLVAQGLGQQQVVAETFKVSQRAKNAHAHVNAGFQFVIKQTQAQRMGHNGSLGVGAPVCVDARIVYGGVSRKTFIAQNAQAALLNAPISAQTLQNALRGLHADLLAVGKSESPLGSQAFRESVMQSCLYRALLRCYPLQALPPSVVSAVLPWVKPVSRGTEVFLPPHGADARENVNPVGKPVRKLEAPIQATGQATYPSDEALPPQGLCAAVVYSRQCAARLVAIDSTRALSMDGVLSVLTAADIPATNEASTDVYLFVPLGEVVPCVGAPLAVVVAATETAANAAAAMVDVSYDASGLPAPVANIRQAVAHQSFHPAPRPFSYLKAGSPDEAMDNATYRVRGHIAAGGQNHFYMETQCAIASIEDGENYTVTCGTQDPSTYQAKIAAVLGVPQNRVIVKCARTGGGFGGKLTGGITNAAVAVLCAAKLGRTVRIFNLRTADMVMQGGREEWEVEYEVGFSADGKINALTYQFYLDGGIAGSDTLGSMYMGMQWADNAYFFPNYEANAKLCYTNTPYRTSMRAPGVVQTCLSSEMVVQRVAAELGLPITTVQERNFIQDGEAAVCGQVVTDCTLPTVWSTLMQRSRYQERFNRATQFNAQNLWRKRGLSICPVKYGMGWAGYGAGVRLGVRSSDGTVTLSHNGCEVGQGINTKAAQAVAMALGIDISLVRVTNTGTDKVVNGGPTGGSGTSEVVVQAALNACQTLNARLDPYRSSSSGGGVRLGTGMRSTAGGIGLGGTGGGAGSTRSRMQQMRSSEWTSLLASLPPEVSLNVEGWYSPSQNPNGQPFQYFVYAACVAEVELDVLSGEVHVLASEIVYDCGQSLNPAVDIGQIEGALVMGLGYFLSERVQYDEKTAELQTPGTWEYKPSMVQDIPSVFNVTLLRNQYNQSGILGSKAVGEPPYVIANSVYFATKMAVASARADAGHGGSFFEMQVPATVDVRQLSSLVHPSRFIMPC